VPFSLSDTRKSKHMAIIVHILSFSLLCVYEINWWRSPVWRINFIIIRTMQSFCIYNVIDTQPTRQQQTLQNVIIDLHCVSDKMHQLWNGVARNCKDLFWRYLSEIFKILWNRVCMLQFSCTFACYHVIASQTAYWNNACMFLLLTGSVTRNFCHFRWCGDAI